MEDIAEDYVNELIDRNVVQVVKTSTNGKVRECRLYDLVRELCIRKGKEENFLKTDMITESLLSSTKSRHMVFTLILIGMLPLNTQHRTFALSSFSN